MAPGSAWANAGIQPVGKMSYELANGAVQEYPFGLAQIEFMGEVTAGRVIFGPEDAEPILRVTALESVGITVDPTNRTLKRLPAIPLKRMRQGLLSTEKGKSSEGLCASAMSFSISATISGWEGETSRDSPGSLAMS